MLSAGIVGLPNVGKSTLFNAVTRTRKAQAANYPFCTIDPNVGIVTVPDSRLQALSKLVQFPETHLRRHRVRRHRRAGARGCHRRGPGQPVPEPHPRGQRHRAGRALFRGRRHSPRFRHGGPGARHRGHQHRIDPRRPRQRAEAPRPQRQDGQVRRQNCPGRERAPRAAHPAPRRRQTRSDCWIAPTPKSNSCAVFSCSRANRRSSRAT